MTEATERAHACPHTHTHTHLKDYKGKVMFIHILNALPNI